MMTTMRRRASVWIGMTALVFAQLAIPVHACPMRSSEREAMTMPCGSTSMSSAVCHEHGRQGAQAVDQTSANAVPDAFVPSFVATLPVAHATPVIPDIVATLVHTRAPPLYLRSARLRF